MSTKTDRAVRDRRIGNLYRKGLSAVEIAAMEGLSACRVLQILKDTNTPTRPAHPRPKPEKLNAHPVMRLLLDAVHDRSLGLSVVCTAGGIQPSTIRKHLKRGTVPPADVFNSFLEGAGVMLRAEPEDAA